MRDIIIKVNNNCMLRCPYCFAHEDAQNELSNNDMQKLLSFCKDNRLESVKITGGEPFLYSNIIEFINTITEFADVMVFSNLMVKNCLSKLNRKDRIKLLVNINEPSFYTKIQYETLLDNLAYAVESGITIIPGRTFYHAPFELSDIVSLCEKYRLKTIRVSQANPTISKTNTWLTASDINDFLHYMRSINEEIGEKGICIDFDCPIAPCIVDGDIYQYFYSRNLLAAKCGTKLVVNPDLTIEHCYITAPVVTGNNIFEYESYEEAMEHLEQQLSLHREKNITAQCRSCVHKCELIPCGCYGFMDLLSGGIANG